MVGVLPIERVACYIRVSSQEQKLHGISLDAQIDKLTEYAKAHGLKIVEWYKDEGVSGRKLIKNRPELQRMLNDAHARKFDRIIFIKLDRFFRSVAEYHECMKYIDPVIWTATEEKYDLSTANGRAFVNMKLTIAELEADQTGERIKIVNEYKIKTGQALTGTQSQGIAYTVKKIYGIKRVVKDPDTQDMVADYINYFLIHQNKKQALEFIKDKYNTTVSYNTMGKVLTDTKICGFYKGNPEYCEPYVDAETFQKIQVILSKNIKTSTTKRVFLFSGLIKCPICGCVLAGECNTNRTQHRPSGKSYTYTTELYTYRCNKHAINHLCTNSKRYNEKKLEKELLDSFDQYVNDYITTVNVADNRADSDNEAINKRIKEVKTEMANSVKSFNKGRMTEAEHDKEYTTLEAELNELMAKLEPYKERDLTIYEELIKSDWKALYEALNRENKRAFWRKYLQGISVDTNGAVVSPIFF